MHHAKVRRTRKQDRTQHVNNLKGTMDNPIVVNSFGDEQYIGCTGCPVDSHITIWLTVYTPLNPPSLYFR